MLVFIFLKTYYISIISLFQLDVCWNEQISFYYGSDTLINLVWRCHNFRWGTPMFDLYSALKVNLLRLLTYVYKVISDELWHVHLVVVLSGPVWTTYVWISRPCAIKKHYQLSHWSGLWLKIVFHIFGAWEVMLMWA